MSSSCEQNRALIAAECAAERPWSAPLEEHLEHCSECAPLAERWARCGRVLAELPRVEGPAALAESLERSLSNEARERRAVGAIALLEPLIAPADLRGRVVATLQDGYRQDRVAGEVRTLGSVEAPPALDGRVEVVLSELREEGCLAAPHAPAELDERVAADLRDLASAISRGAMTKLDRREVPGDLGQRVEGGLRGTPAMHRSRLRIGGLAAAAALMIYAGISVATHSSTEDAPGWAITVEHDVDLEALSPLARAVASPLVRGLDARLLGLPTSSRVEIQVGEDALGATRPNSSTSSIGATGATRGAKPTNGGTTGGTQTAGAGGGAGTAGPGSGSAPLSGFPRFGPDYFNATIDAPFTVHYRGDRRVLTRTLEVDLLVEVDYREEVASDGQGKFALIPRDVITPAMGANEAAAFKAVQERRDSFFYQYRDFRVRDYGGFWRSYEVQHRIGQTEVVAGVVCERFDVQHRSGTGGVYTVAVDPVTSLVLSEEYRAANGELVHKTWFETLVLGADLSDLQLDDISGWTVFDPQSSAGLFNEPPLIPSTAPTGYELESASYKADATGTGTTWARFVYTDGLRQTFFLTEEGQGAGGNGGSMANVGSSAGDYLRLFVIGEWTIAEGQVGGSYALAFGRVDGQELVLMLQSAVE